MKDRPLSTILTVLGGSALTVLMVLTVKTWAGMFLPLQTAMGIAVAGALIPGVLVNKVLTKQYQKIEPEASEMGSIFGTLILVNGISLALILLGVFGLPADVALEETLTRSYATLGFLDKPLAATLAPYPRSESGTGVIWVPNLGTLDQPRIIARNENDVLKASYLPPKGKTFEAKHDTIVGPARKLTGRVLLCPVPGKNDPYKSEVQHAWEDGTVRFVFNGKRCNYYFTKRK